MFSPILATSAARVASTVSPDGRTSSLSAAASLTLLASAASATALAKATKLPSLATKSVSQLTSTSTASPLPTRTATRPSAATRPAFLAALTAPDLRMLSMASSMSPLASWRAFLHSIMPAPVRSRSSLTRPAVISMGMSSCDGGSLGSAAVFQEFLTKPPRRAISWNQFQKRGPEAPFFYGRRRSDAAGNYSPWASAAGASSTNSSTCTSSPPCGAL